MCVLSTLCGNVDKHSPFDIYICVCVYIYIYTQSLRLYEIYYWAVTPYDSKLFIQKGTVGCHYNVVQYYMMLHTSLQLPRLNINRNVNPQMTFQT